MLAALLACVPVVAALFAVSRALELGADAPWTLMIMVGDGQLGLAMMASAAFLVGGVLGAVALAAAGEASSPPAPEGAPPGELPGEHPSAQTSV
jgi:hypothetical protein